MSIAVEPAVLHDQPHDLSSSCQSESGSPQLHATASRCESGPAPHSNLSGSSTGRHCSASFWVPSSRIVALAAPPAISPIQLSVQPPSARTMPDPSSVPPSSLRCPLASPYRPHPTPPEALPPHTGTAMPLRGGWRIPGGSVHPQSGGWCSPRISVPGCGTGWLAPPGPLPGGGHRPPREIRRGPCPPARRSLAWPSTTWVVSGE